MTDRDNILVPSLRLTPVILFFTIPIETTSPSIIIIFFELKINREQRDSYFLLSTCARGDQTDLPFDLFSILCCRPDKSAIFAINPPSKSTSRTNCPLATPPIAGLHDILPNPFLSIDTSPTIRPSFERMFAASTPA